MYKIYADNTLFCSSKIEDLAILNPVVELEGNTAGTFSFVIPPKHPYYDLIQRRKTIIDVYRDDDAEPLFEGICVSDETDFFKQKQIKCEGELTFFNDSNLRPAYRQGVTSRQLLEAYVNEHNSLVEAQKRFTVGEVTVHDSNDSITCYTNYQSTMQEIKEDLIDDLGGWLRTRHENGIRYVDYLAESPRTNNQVIRLGENLLDLAKNIDTDELATVVIPLGTTLEESSIAGLDERLTIRTAPADTQHPSGADYVYSASAVETFGWIERVVEWDDVTTVTALINKGKAYLSDSQYEKMVITAKAIDLGLTSDEFQKFKLLDMIRVISEPHGLDRYFMLSKMTINLNNPEQDSITLGIEDPKSLSAKTVSASEKIKRKIEQMPTTALVKSAIDNATALITGAEGGYVVIERNNDGQPIEIKVQDALNNPTKIWRWNVNGLGYSSDGGQTYGLAMTMDGAIVADFITSGVMSANRINGGTLKLGGVNNSNGLLQIVNANNQEVGHWDKDGIRLIRGTVGGWTIGENQIATMDGTSQSNSTILMTLAKYQGNPLANAFAFYKRNNTSDPWTTQFAIRFDGAWVASETIEIFVNAGYGFSIHGALHTDGKINNSNNYESDGSISIRGSGWADGGWAGGSDERLKQDIEDLTNDFAETILKNLQPKVFELKSDPDTHRSGLIAQEVMQVLEDNNIDPTFFVRKHEDFDTQEELYGLAYDELVSVLIKGWQMHEQEIQELKKEIKAMKGENK